ncbi:flavodoxin [Frankia sp. ACN1ag]|nr:flavodoxin [Frankia sp. ACN1ag]
MYYPCLEATIGRPYALYVHGNSDTTGAVRGVETITTGLKWKRLRDPLTVLGEVDATARDTCWELGATVAASLMPD